MENRETAVRRESRNIAGRFRGGKLAPVMAVPFLGGEGGMLSQTATITLDPVAGQIITPVTAEMISVFVPVPAIDAIKAPDAEYAGLPEVIRQKLLSGNPLFGLENEGELTKRLGIIPRSVGGVKKVNEMARLAHNCAVNFLRKRKYVYAVELLHSNTAVTPALLGSTALDRLNGVLDPDDRINGQVQLAIADMQLPVMGLRRTDPTLSGDHWAMNNQGTGPDTGKLTGNAQYIVTKSAVGGVTENVYAALNGAVAGGLSLVDFYNAQRRDALVRTMSAIVEANPLDGEDMVLRWAYGLSVDPGRHPFVLYEGEVVFGEMYREATDGAGMADEVAVSKLKTQVRFSVPVPRTELGGIVITFLTVKPDETLAMQPHPILSDAWGAIKHPAEEMKLDPVGVTMRELSADVAAGLESTIAFYTGYNELKKAYVNYGFNRHLDPTTVENKTAVWQLEIPTAVTPENIIYPAELSHYPFLDQLAEVATYAIQSEAVIRTPLFFGPTPVEELAIIDNADLLEE